MIDIEDIILKFFIEKSDYSLKIFPYIKKEYFYNIIDQNIIKYVSAFYHKYNKLPSYDILLILTNREKNYSETLLKDGLSRIDYLKTLDAQYNEEWLLEQTEEFFREMALKNCLSETINDFDDKDKRSLLPVKAEQALSISLDSSIGHDYFEDVDKQYAYYQSEYVKFPVHITGMNLSTGGGFQRKTLNIVLGAPCSGKSQLMVDISSYYVMHGLNVLYVSLELFEESVRQRVDANLMQHNMNNFMKIDEKKYYTAFEELKRMPHGHLIIKEYPTGGASILTLKNLIREIKHKKGWIPDVVIADYLGIMSSARPANGNMYLQGKYIAEDLRALAVEINGIVFAPAQINKGGYNKLDADMSNVAESAGISHVADYMVVIGRNSELDDAGEVYFNTIKNRLNSLQENKGYNVGYNSNYMKFFNVENKLSNMIPKTTNDDYIDEMNKLEIKETKLDKNKDKKFNTYSEENFLDEFSIK